jgi:hypothetical protein
MVLGFKGTNIQMMDEKEDRVVKIMKTIVGAANQWSGDEVFT